MRDNSSIPIILFVVIIAVLSLVYFLNQKSECENQGGVLVRDALTGLYKCASEVK